MPVLTNEAAAARGATYGLLARVFDEPSRELHEDAVDGSLRAAVEELLDRSALDVPVPSLDAVDDHDDLCARFNDLFTVGFAEYQDRTDGTLASRGPPVSMYETAYRPESSWNDVNLDLARAYDYYGLGVDESNREHHDHLRLELEFAGFLARREATGETDAALARLDFLDRHLRVVAAGVAERLEEEPGTSLYGDAGDLLAAFTAADRADLLDRFDDGGVR
jgi:DMSO reductase family type II enzyme chaperone